MGCERSSLTDGTTDTFDCSSCHGTVGSPAPPKAVNGATSTTDIGVGAHSSHLLGSNIAGPVACNECHLSPTSLLTHPNIDAEHASVVFGSVAKLNLRGIEPSWVRSSATCANTYCHGSTLSGSETRPAPIWTKVDGTQRNCASCHGFPPVSHTTGGACDSCHGDVAGPAGTIKNPARHVDGVLDLRIPTAHSGVEGGAARYAMRLRPYVYGQKRGAF